MQAGLDQFYGADFLQRCKAAHAVDSLLSTKTAAGKRFRNNGPVAAPEPRVIVDTSENMEEMPSGNLGLQSREEMQEEGHYITDDRDASETADGYPSNATVGLDNPTETGTYKVLTAWGGFFFGGICVSATIQSRTAISSCFDYVGRRKEATLFHCLCERHLRRKQKHHEHVPEDVGRDAREERRDTQARQTRRHHQGQQDLVGIQCSQ